MICEICHKQEATVNWTSFNPSAGTEEDMKLCQACADARTPPEALQQIRKAQAHGKSAVSGWTGYNPVPDEDDRPSA
jgi:protein-arginine kinase activator protein McsA